MREMANRVNKIDRLLAVESVDKTKGRADNDEHSGFNKSIDDNMIHLIKGLQLAKLF